MIVLHAFLIFLVVTAPAGAAEVVLGARDAPLGLAPVSADAPRSRAEAGDMRCSSTRAHCISEARYIPDVCRTIEAVARENALDPHFLARLLWKESLFEANALSPAGAQGIAQFMPETARLQGLGDPFNPAEALEVSARYLADLSQDLGNIGLAAVAYNSGENRAARFVAGEGGLPLETRDYVRAITGHSAEVWRDAPPASVDLALAAGPFQPACVAHAAKRGRPGTEFVDPLSPWGVIVASNRAREGAERQVGRLMHRHGAVLAGERISYARTRLPGLPRRLYNAQLGRETRDEAEAVCARLRSDGGSCMVMKN